MTWFTIVIQKDYEIFTDEETVPASSDFFAALFGIEETEQSAEE